MKGKNTKTYEELKLVWSAVDRARKCGDEIRVPLFDNNDKATLYRTLRELRQLGVPKERFCRFLGVKALGDSLIETFLRSESLASDYHGCADLDRYLSRTEAWFTSCMGVQECRRCPPQFKYSCSKRLGRRISMPTWPDTDSRCLSPLVITLASPASAHAMNLSSSGYAQIGSGRAGACTSSAELIKTLRKRVKGTLGRFRVNSSPTRAYSSMMSGERTS